MDSEKPYSLRSVLTRIVCTLLGVLLLYVVGYGPANYVYQRFPNSRNLITAIYDPLEAATDKTPLERPLNQYMGWWLDIADVFPSERIPQTAPATP